MSLSNPRSCRALGLAEDSSLLPGGPVGEEAAPQAHPLSCTQHPAVLLRASLPRLRVPCQKVGEQREGPPQRWALLLLVIWMLVSAQVPWESATLPSTQSCPALPSASCPCPPPPPRNPTSFPSALGASSPSLHAFAGTSSWLVGHSLTCPTRFQKQRSLTLSVIEQSTLCFLVLLQGWGRVSLGLELRQLRGPSLRRYKVTSSKSDTKVIYLHYEQSQAVALLRIPTVLAAEVGGSQV